MPKFLTLQKSRVCFRIDANSWCYVPTPNTTICFLQTTAFMHWAMDKKIRPTEYGDPKVIELYLIESRLGFDLDE